MSIDPQIAAQEIREETWGDRFPVDPVTIARSLGVKVRETDLPPEVSGAIIKERGSDAIIVVHSDDSDNRKRFTVSHELGHYVSRSYADQRDKFEYVDYRSPKSAVGDNEEEVFANQFAANLLMPEQEVRKQYKLHNKVIPAVAFFFGVSSDAMTFRLKNLRIIP